MEAATFPSVQDHDDLGGVLGYHAQPASSPRPAIDQKIGDQREAKGLAFVSDQTKATRLEVHDWVLLLGQPC